MASVLLSAIACIAAAIALVWASWRLWLLYFAWKTPIAAGLPRNFRDAQAEFRRRVAERFPIGSPEIALIRELSSQGFARLPGYKQGTSRRFFRRGLGLPPPSWLIAWQVDDHGDISEVSAHYRVFMP